MKYFAKQYLRSILDISEPLALLLYSWTSTSPRSINTQKELGQYPAILTPPLVKQSPCYRWDSSPKFFLVHRLPYRPLPPFASITANNGFKSRLGWTYNFLYSQWSEFACHCVWREATPLQHKQCLPPYYANSRVTPAQ